MITIKFLHAQVLWFNYYKKDNLQLQEIMWEQDKYGIQYFLQMHGHIMYQHDTTTSYQGNGTTFFIFTSS